MSKIGILTHHSVYNFGANLQALSTQEALRKRGHDAYIINWIPQDLHNIYLTSTPKIQCDIHEKFFSERYRLTDVCHTSKEIALLLEKEQFDAVIIGSDAVVRHFSFLYRYSPSRKGFKKNYLNSTDIYPNPYWGDFYKYLKTKIPIAMMSVSSQGTYWKDIKGLEKYRIGRSLRYFSYISVRDSFTKDAFTYFSKNRIVPSITPDPVFSFNQNLGLQEISEKEPYVIFSFKKQTLPPKNWLENLRKQFNNNGYKVISLPFPQEECDFEVDEKIKLPLSPLEWYEIIKKSSGYIGNNMHPIVVALHNAVPIFVFDYYAVKRNRFSAPEITMSKIYDLISIFGNKENYYNIQFGYDNIPSCEYVYEKIISMNRCELHEFSKKMKNDYDFMINDMLMKLNLN